MSLMTSLLMEDCFCCRNTKCSVADCSETCLWYGKIHLRCRMQTLSTWKIGNMLYSVISHLIYLYSVWTEQKYSWY